MATRTETDPFDPGVVPQGPATNMFASAPAAPTSGPVVFVGWAKGYNRARDEVVKRMTPRYMPVEQFLAGMSAMSRDEFLKLRNLMVAAGMVEPGAGVLEVESVMETVVMKVAGTSTSNTGKMSPLGYIKNIARMNGFDPGEIGSDPDYGADGQDDLFTGKRKRVSRTINEITEGQAWASIQENLQQMLGRDPSDQEVRDFMYRMNQMAASNPNITTTVRRYKNGELVGQTQRNAPGFTADDVAREAYDQAQNDPEYAEYTAATVYFDALQQALGAIGG